MVKQIKSATDYEDAVAATPVVLVDFYANWCGPCKFIAPQIDKLDQEYNKEGAEHKGRVSFIKVDVDELFELAEKLKVMAMPTFMLYLGGKLIKTIVGVNLEAIKIALEEAVVAEIPVEPEVTEQAEDEVKDEAKDEATGEDDPKVEGKVEGDGEEAVEKVA